jgi:hypothetical protein
MSFSRANKVYLGMVTALCVVYLLSLMLLPHVHILTTRRVIAWAYAISKLTILPVVYMWLVLDDNKSLPWRDRRFLRHGIAAIVLFLTALYIRHTHSIDVRWAGVAFGGALLSGFSSVWDIGASVFQRFRGRNPSFR